MPVTVVLVIVLAAMFLPLIWEVGDDNEWYGRSLGVVAVLTAAFTLLVPILHRASRGEIVREEAEIAVRFCPRCGSRLAEQAGEGAEIGCARCGARFAVRFGGSGTIPSE
jgi:DNA-directed RNA polymerase subunit RPC12/RpoP